MVTDYVQLRETCMGARLVGVAVRGVLSPIAVLTIVLVVAGCSDGVTSSGSGDDRVIEGDVAGSWRSTAGATGEIAIDVTVTTRDVSGRVMRHTNTRCPVTTFSGSYSETARTVTGEFSGPSGVMSWSATLRGDVLSGPYQYVRGQCSGERGSMSLTRR